MNIAALLIVSSEIELLRMVDEEKLTSGDSFISPFLGLNATRNNLRVANQSNQLLSDDDLDILHKSGRISDEDFKQKRPFYLREIM